MSSTERFDEAAGTWDQEDRRVQLAQAVAQAIASRLAPARDWTALDFGCGTGLVTLALAPKVVSMAAADTSPGMLAALEAKAGAAGVPVRLIQLDDGGGGDLGGPYHLILSSMTLHHVADVPALLRQLGQHLRPGGQVALADLDLEDGSFHEDKTGVHHAGFGRDQVKGWLEAAGFREIEIETAAVVRKGGQSYPVFLATARRD